MLRQKIWDMRVVARHDDGLDFAFTAALRFGNIRDDLGRTLAQNASRSGPACTGSDSRAAGLATLRGLCRGFVGSDW